MANLANNKLKLLKGTNISHWLSQSDARGEERRKRFTAEDVKYLADFGFDHLRLPVDEEQMWDDDFKKNNEAWDLLHEGIEWCRNADLKVVVDLHVLRCHHFNGENGENTLFTDPAKKLHFTECWRQLSGELSRYGNDFLAYELMNEAVADDPSDWNRVLLAPYRVIREKEPLRYIAIGSNRWCQAQTFPQLEVPLGDTRIILVVHYYNPMLITHYRASWTASIRDYSGP
ncbi:MAG TPA: cellulase family glycosylhydrolase, partial [Victivallales bacterium]|nr:cellulase family glycosylhydrolase [Victivallales bacterium]